jgi:hypothetical protein
VWFVVLCGGFYDGVDTGSFVLVIVVAGAGFCGGGYVFFVAFQILRRCSLFQELSCSLWFCGVVCFLGDDLPVLN